MLIAILSDIHANLVALEAVLEQLPSYDYLWCLGDTIGYGPRPANARPTSAASQPMFSPATTISAAWAPFR